MNSEKLKSGKGTAGQKKNAAPGGGSVWGAVGGGLGGALHLLQGHHLVDAALMATTLELGVQPGVHDLHGQHRADDAGARSLYISKHPT